MSAKVACAPASPERETAFVALRATAAAAHAHADRQDAAHDALRSASRPSLEDGSLAARHWVGGSYWVR